MGLLGLLKRKKNPREELKKKLKGFELPYLPKAALLALEAIRDPHTSVPEIARRVAADPGLHLKILRTVNSAAFGLPRQVTNIEHAVALLGRARLESLLLPLAVKEALPPFDAPCLDHTLFWLTAAKRGSFARKFAQVLHPHSSVEAFSAGLLQDVAVPIIIHLSKDNYCPVLETWNTDPDVDVTELERKTFGYDHQDIGHLVAEEWDLPAYLSEAISAHHEDKVEPAVFLASHLRYSREQNEIEKEIVAEIAKQQFNIPKDQALNMLLRAQKEAEELARVFL